MHYNIRHVTRFTYETPVSESVMEARMQPRSDLLQHCLHFGLKTQPASRVMLYQDHQGNVVHHFNIPSRHSRLTVTAEALVECEAVPELPEALAPGGWERLDALTASGEFWDLLAPSAFARRSPLLDALVREPELARGDDPLVMLRGLSASLYDRFEYSPESTSVDSPIDHALESRQGVCQDFAHIMIAVVRQLGMPCRYVSGYLFQDEDHTLRSSDGATHAWIEALVPDVGWVGIDPTNNLVASDRHIRVAVGRDYADVPPTRGVYKGLTAVRTELAVGVRVGPALARITGDASPFVPWMSREASAPLSDSDSSQQRQAQQVQQQ
ncbi:MAG: transglutaminase family protein [Acidobacteriota bacterium]